MDTFTTTLGGFTLAHGLFWVLMHFKKTGVHDKAFRLASRAGFSSRAAFTFTYATVPLIVGLILLIAGLKGFSILSFF